MTGTPVTLHASIAEEDLARAEFYALLGRLYVAAPDAPLLAAVGASELRSDAHANPLSAAWNQLVLASRAMDAEAAEQEYTDLFVGVGKAECNLHAAYWIPDAAQRPLVAIRAELAALGLRRLHESAVYEDQLGALFEVMRVLIAGAPGRAPEPIDVQMRFFQRFLSGWVDACCAAITQCPVANYYRRVAQFTNAFMAVERDSFAID
jgi:TorA maturation chaperone TorD